MADLRPTGYARVRSETRAERAKSDTIELRECNNLIKRILIRRGFERLPAAFPDALVVRVYDMCGGQGGDLKKLLCAAHDVDRSVLLYHKDLTAESSETAFKRADGMKFKEMQPERVNGRGVTIPDDVMNIRPSGDCFEAGSVPFPDDGQAFHVVNCQLAIHYAAATEGMLHTALDNIASALQPGGVLIVSYPEAACMRDYALRERQHEYCRVRFLDTMPVDTTFGNAVHVLIGDPSSPKVNDPEPLLPAGVMERELEKRGFVKILHMGFQEIWDEATRRPQDAALLRARAPRPSRDDWDVIGLYYGGIFVKMS